MKGDGGFEKWDWRVNKRVKAQLVETEPVDLKKKVKKSKKKTKKNESAKN